MVDTSIPWRDLLAATVTDRLSGARNITIDAASVIVAWGHQSPASDLGQLHADLRDISRELLQAQPAMASLLNLLNVVWQAAGQVAVVEGAAQQISGAADAFSRALEGIGELVARQALPLLSPASKVLTISASSTIFAALRHARNIGLSVQVVCLESRPMFEGRTFAAKLAEVDIRVALVVDAAAYQEVRGVDMVLVGVDSFSPGGMVGKIGTGGLALGAKDVGIPVYALGDRTKIWPARVGLPFIRERAGDEVWSKAAEGVEIRNRYFDVADWSLFTGIVVEDGVFNASDVVKASRSIVVHGELANIYRDLAGWI
jgi:translation initiation factor 2B subunit (eIF-2B alpha/beta/delta family)